MNDSPPDIEDSKEANEGQESSESTPRPQHLQAVKEDDLSAPAEVEAVAVAEDEGKAGSRVVWLLGVALLVCGFFMLMQARENSLLDARVDALGAELAEAGEALSAAEATITRFELRMDEVRGSVGELLTRMGALQQLVDRDPKADAPGVPTE